MTSIDTIDTDDVKTAFSRIGKSVAIITLSDEEGRHATVSSAFMYLTQQPPSLLIALEKKSSLYGKLTGGESFAVNVLADGHQGVVDACARQKGEARFTVGEWVLAQGLPILADAQAVFICKQEQLTEYETHGVMIASIQSLQFDPHLSPLIFVGGGLQTCVGELY